LKVHILQTSIAQIKKGLKDYADLREQSPNEAKLESVGSRISRSIHILARFIKDFEDNRVPNKSEG
jgi:hypothetical protein